MLIRKVGGRGAAASAETNWIWNSADMGDVTLSATDHVATFNSAGHNTVRGATALTGKKFFLLRANTASGSYLGVANGSHSLTTNIGAGTNSVGQTTTLVRYNSTTVVTVTALADGSIIMFAVDADTGKVWMGDYLTQTWYNSGDPAAGTGEVATLTGTLYPAASGTSAAPSVVQALSMAVPTDFTKL